MSYAIADIELGLPLPALDLGADATGVAVLLRRGGRPIGFFLQEMSPATTLGAEELGRLISRHAAVDLLRASLEDELLGSAEPHPPVDLTVAICTRDRPELLAVCLNSLLAAGQDQSFRVLVVDNAPSDDRTRELVQSRPGVEYVREPKPGLDFARNRAIAEGSTEFLAFIDDDVVVDPGWVGGLAAALGTHPDLGGVTGQVLPYELATEAQIKFERHISFRRGFQQVRYSGQVREGNALYPTGPGIFGAGCNMAFRTEVLRALGGFDDALDTGRALAGGGDLDIFYRLIRAGHVLVYEPRFLAFHRHRRELDALRRQYWSWGTGYMAFLHKTYRRDPEARPKLRRMMVWWVWDQLRQLKRTLREGSVMSPDMVVAQLAGGLLTVLWKYPSSRRRTDRIRHTFA